MYDSSIILSATKLRQWIFWDSPVHDDITLGWDKQTMPETVEQLNRQENIGHDQRV